MPHPDIKSAALPVTQPAPKLAEIDKDFLRQLYVMFRNPKKEAGDICQPTEQELVTFVHYCYANTLDPLGKDIYFIKDKNGKVHYQISIDGLRARSESSGHYKGRIGPLWVNKNGEWFDHWIWDEAPMGAKVGILREGYSEPIWGFARFASYCQSKESWSNWGKMPEVMIAKCAEAQAQRAAFPKNCAHLYVAEEMMEMVEGKLVEELPAAQPVKKFGSPNVTPELAEKSSLQPKPTPEPEPEPTEAVLVEKPAEPEPEPAAEARESLVKKAAGLFGGRILDAAAEEVVDITDDRPLDPSPEAGLFDPPPAQEFDPENDNEPASPAEVDEAWKAWVKVHGREREGQEKLRSIGVPTLRGTPTKKLIRLIHEHLNSLTQEATF